MHQEATWKYTPWNHREIIFQSGDNSGHIGNPFFPLHTGSKIFWLSTYGNIELEGAGY